jgi:protease-4
LTQEEKALIMRDLAIMHKNFISLVATNRNLSVDRVTQMADGSSMLGEMALKNGLIDEIGGMNEALVYLKEQLAIDPVICKEQN